MSSSDHLHPGQLQMFMPARELHVSDEDFGGDLVPGDYQPGRHGTYKTMWQQKLNEATATEEFRKNPHYAPDNPLTSDEWADVEYFEEHNMSVPPDLTREFHSTHKSVVPLQEGIKDEGIKTPVSIAYDEDMAQTWTDMGVTPKPPNVGQRVIVNGHHRIAAAHDLSPDTEVPVQYSKSSPRQDATALEMLTMPGQLGLSGARAKAKMEDELDAMSKAPDDRQSSVTDVRRAVDLLPPGRLVIPNPDK